MDRPGERRVAVLQHGEHFHEQHVVGPAEFTKFLHTRMAEYKEFYDAIGLAKRP